MCLSFNCLSKIPYQRSGFNYSEIFMEIEMTTIVAKDDCIFHIVGAKNCGHSKFKRA